VSYLFGRFVGEIMKKSETYLGGYESGMDAAVNLVALGKKVRVLDYLR
jgi:alkyl hydroperoxide reductase subunit AhpF